MTDLRNPQTSSTGVPHQGDLLAELKELRLQLEEAEDTLRAIREGEVDALVVREPRGDRVYTLKSADRPYRIMIEEMGQGAATVLPDGTILYCNRCFAGMLQAPLESLFGTSLHAYLAPLSREPIARLLAAGATQGSGRGELQLRTAGGELVPAYAAVTALNHDEGPVLCLVVTDLTGQKPAAAAEAANRAKDQFLATLSHELRTPLTPVLALVSGLEADGRLPYDVRSRLAMMRRNLELEARLIDDMLDLTRISRGKLELRREPADLDQILEHALQTTESDVLAKQLRLVTKLCCGGHLLLADTPRLTQVFWNLLHNAAKFTPSGGAISVRSWKEATPDGEGGWLVAEVSDTGIGIEADTLDQIFDAFDQGLPGTARRFGGLGLGLAISRAIIEMHRGTLEAASAGRGQGATFTVRLPLGKQPVAAAPRSAAAPESTLRNTGSAHILLVEDHADTAEAIAELLRGLGYEITIAESVAAALAAVDSAQNQGSQIDLVVSDLGLPDGSGLDLMRTLSSRYGLRGIALSGYGMEEDVQQSRAAGFERHVTKPVSLQDLQAALEAALQPGL